MMKSPARRHWLGLTAGVAVLGVLSQFGNTGTPGATAGMGAANAASPARPCAWPLYRQFLARFVQADGRVVDPSTREQHSTSEGQSYGMVFALIANDRETFDRLWQWSIANLGAGSLADKLPAWQWGRRNDGTWGVLDPNAASDADIWFAYALAEGARLWKAPAYAEAARALLAQVERHEVVSLPGFGTMLLPGQHGFVQGKPGGAREWRLNASYLPVPVLRRLGAFAPAGPWSELANQTARLIQGVARDGIVPDWSAYRDDPTAQPPVRGFVIDPQKGDVSSYDAIRVYLWAGMTPAADPASAALMRTLAPVARRLDGRAAPPEKMMATTGALQGDGPLGFSAALLPFLQASGTSARTALATQRQRAASMIQPDVAGAQPPAASATAPTYYDTVLGLFGLGYDEQRYKFARNGQLQLEWETACRSAGAPQ